VFTAVCHLSLSKGRCPAHFILLDLVTIIILLGEEHKSCILHIHEIVLDNKIFGDETKQKMLICAIAKRSLKNGNWLAIPGGGSRAWLLGML